MPAASAAPATYRLATGPEGLRLAAVTPDGDRPLLNGLSFEAAWADGSPAFATKGVGPTNEEGARSVTLEGPAAADAAVTLRIEERPRHLLLTWRITYRGPKREFHGWTTGFRCHFAAPPTSASTDTPILWRRPTGAYEWEVVGDTPYPDFEWQFRRVRWGSGAPELVVATDWYDADWIHGGNVERASYHRAGLPAESPAEVVRRMAIFVLPEAGESGEALAAEASGRPAALVVETPHGFLFEPGTPVTFALRARSLEGSAPCRLVWEVWDYYGERVANGEEPLREPQWRTVPVRVSYPKRGMLFLDARLLPAAGEVQGATLAPLHTRRATFAVLPRRPASPPRLESPFGLAALIANPELYPDQPRLEEVLSLVQRIGVRWLRTGFALKAELTSEEQQAIRRRFSLLKEHGIALHAQLGTGLPKPEEVGGMKTALRATLGVLRGLSNHLELGNELNASVSAKDYVERLLRPSTEVIRKELPEARVFTMGLGGVQLDWLRELEACGGLELVDVLSIHPGSFPKAPEMFNGWRGWFFPPQVVDALAAARRHGKRDVWITEAYSPTGPTRLGLDVRTSADYLVRTYVISLALGVKVIEWYQFQDGTWYAQCPKPTDIEHSFGIVHTDLSPKPAYVAFGVMTEKLEGFRALGRLDLGASDLYGVRFARGDRVVDVLWSYREKHEVDLSGWPPERYAHRSRLPLEPWQQRWVEAVRVKLPAAGAVQVTDLMGNTTTVKPEGRAVRLELSGSPLFVEGLGKLRLQKAFWNPELFAE